MPANGTPGAPERGPGRRPCPLGQRRAPEPAEAHRGEDEARRRGGEPARDLAPLALPADARAEVAVDRVEAAGALCREGTAAGDLRDPRDDSGVGRHGDGGREVAETVGDGSAGCAESDAVDGDAGTLGEL